MLLLIVLMMLSLFMVTGIAMLTMATRARSVARATLSANNSRSMTEDLTRAALDEALLAALRGTKTGEGDPITESILADKYGDPITAKGTIAQSSKPNYLVTLEEFSAAPPPHPCRLNGRVLTIQPDPGDGDMMSFRVLSAAQSTDNAAKIDCIVRQTSPGRTQSVPKLKSKIIINGREFTPTTTANASTPESYDAFDDSNKWLAKPTVDSGQVTAVPRPSFFNGNAVDTKVDNDGDGIPDGVWTANVIPSTASPLGGTLSFQVSYLIMDLDGRININAHGTSGPPGSYPASLDNVPVGMGYGPADIDLSTIIPPSSSTQSTATPSDFSSGTQTLVGGGAPSRQSANPSAEQPRSPPLIGRVDGRYGQNGKPGIPVVATTVNANSPADLKARAKVYMSPPAVDELVSTLNFNAPDWVTAPDDVNNTYQLRLDADAPRSSSIRNKAAENINENDDNPYTIAELELLLRSNDPDVMRLPQRLAAIFEKSAARSRMAVTTDSWDTPALTGQAARKIEDYMASFPAPTRASTQGIYGVLPTEIAAGLRFNINREVKINDPTDNISYCKELYTLLIALGVSDKAKAAQWAVNVLDFRDKDSTMSRFPYDTNLQDGWNLDDNSPVVYGVERPDVLLVKTVAYYYTASRSTTSKLLVTLYRPAWNVKCLNQSGDTNQSPLNESLDKALSTGESLDLAKTTETGSAVWQLRYGGNTTPIPRAVRFSSGAAAALPKYDNKKNLTTSAATSAQLAPNKYLCIRGMAPQITAYNTGVVFTVDKEDSVQTVMTSDAFHFGTATTGMVSLERLADPNQQYDAKLNPYVTVDSCLVVKNNQTASALIISPTQQRSGPADPTPASFWQQQWTDNSDVNLGKYTSAGTANPVPWLHWPNRPFVSQAELALVPSDSPEEHLKNYSKTGNSLAQTAASLIVDATYVPSKFIGNNTTAVAALFGSKYATTASAFREPGRMNVNTMSLDGSPLSGKSAWKALIAGKSTTKTSNPFSSIAATSVGQMLSLSNTDGVQIFSETFPNTDQRSNNPFLAMSLPISLANTGTIRSQVFAVWITVKVTDDSANASAPLTKRLFAIVDRSIPVGYAPAQNLNVSDCVRLKRFID